MSMNPNRKLIVSRDIMENLVKKVVDYEMN